MQVKNLIEKQEEAREKMAALVATAKEEARALTDEEARAFDAYKVEIEGLEETINRIEEVENMELKPIPPAGSPQLTDSEKFANIIRGIYNAGTGDAGKVTIPTTIGAEIFAIVKDICPIFNLAQVYNVPGKLVLVKENGSDLAMDYATEGTAAGVTGVQFAENLELSGFLASVLTKIPNSLINQSGFDIVAYVKQRMAEEIAKFLEKELLTGATKIHGLAAGVTQAVTSAKATAVTADELVDVQGMVPDGYQPNAVWFMNRKTRDAIRKLKDGQGNYLLVPDFSAQGGYSILGKPVFCSDNLPEMGASATAIYYGDMTGLAVKVGEAIELNVLREAYYPEHATGLCAFVDVDAGVQNTQKIACLKMHTA